MIDLDKYLKQSVDIKINGEIVEVLQPTARLTKEISKLEQKVTEENYLDTRGKTAHIILNNNASNRIFTMEEVDEIPFKLQDIIIKEITSLVYKADNDPN
ncbi:hypothetical protein [Clostridium gasigenes]|uniref:Uncharacterized protein n=1 Tax=Clostridium gasigenes TaxID=94869 RepID=A0A1H0M811_9CLOT|nr:hypothetical protein [Clostridium gasigenes]MBB6622233.1 hypothetical protein [Clostridium gasigenes]SDO76632.1 hypothetical protein SAMN04488529_101360 [Clostridium gasigenes]